MCAKRISAWLCGAAAVDAEVATEVGADEDVDASVLELPHAPMAATAASVTIPAATVPIIFTTDPFVIYL